MYCGVRISVGSWLKKGRVRARNSLLWCNLLLPKAREILEVTFRTFSLMQLPKLELKKFHENPIHWYPFWKSFESAVHKNYLKSLLTGTVQSSVSGLARTSVYYEKALELLKRRFGNR